MKLVILFTLFSTGLFASLPSSHTSLLPFVQEAPDQGDTATCLYMSTTGAIELLLNQKHNIRHPNKGDIFDISERYTLSQRASSSGSFHLKALNRLNKGWAILDKDLPFNAYTESGGNNRAVWRRPVGFYDFPRVDIPERFEAEKLFIRGRNRYSKYVVRDGDIKKIKEKLVEHNAPILINYNHRGWWHMVLIVGYDDNVTGDCLYTPEEQCKGSGSFYVRDSLGKKTHARTYDWFRVNGNAAFVVKLKIQ